MTQSGDDSRRVLGNPMAAQTVPQPLKTSRRRMRSPSSVGSALWLARRALRSVCPPFISGGAAQNGEQHHRRTIPPHMFVSRLRFRQTIASPPRVSITPDRAECLVRERGALSINVENVVGLKRHTCLVRNNDKTLGFKRLRNWALGYCLCNLGKDGRVREGSILPLCNCPDRKS
jgi:hypothetical protein